MLFHTTFHFNRFTIFIIVVSFPSKQSRVDGSIVELRVSNVEVVKNFFTCIKENVLSNNVSSQNILNPKASHSINGTLTVSCSTVSTDNSEIKFVCQFLHGDSCIA